MIHDMQPLLQVNVWKRANSPDPRDEGLPRNNGDTQFRVNFDFVSDKPQNEIFTFSGAVEALTLELFINQALNDNIFSVEEKRKCTTLKNTTDNI